MSQQVYPALFEKRPKNVTASWAVVVVVVFRHRRGHAGGARQSRHSLMSSTSRCESLSASLNVGSSRPKTSRRSEARAGQAVRRCSSVSASSSHSGQTSSSTCPILILYERRRSECPVRSLATSTLFARVRPCLSPGVTRRGPSGRGTSWSLSWCSIRSGPAVAVGTWRC